MFVGLGRNTNRQVHHLTIAPIHPFRELQQTHARGKHQLAGFRGAVGDGDALAQKGRALSLTRLQAAQITFGHQAIGNQFIGQQLQRRRFIHSRLAHGYLLYSELEHAFSFPVLNGNRYCFELSQLRSPVPGCVSRCVANTSLPGQAPLNTAAETFNQEYPARYCIIARA